LEPVPPSLMCLPTGHPLTQAGNPAGAIQAEQPVAAMRRRNIAPPSWMVFTSAADATAAAATAAEGNRQSGKGEGGVEGVMM